jgi:hypothetical protein
MKLEGKANPFYAVTHDGNAVYTIDVDDRLSLVREMGPNELRRVISMSGVQKTVQKAAASRLRRLERGTGK